MIPAFPNFKKIELSDRADIEDITRKFAPYSDFNFTSLWSWDTEKQARISQLNGNLIVRFTDYQTHQLFYSFLGNSQVSETAKALLHLSEKEGLETKLRLVPNDSIIGLNDTFSVIEDRDHFDYVYDLTKLRDYKGNSLELHRRANNKFIHNNPSIISKEVNINDADIQSSIIKVIENWRLNKIAAGKDVKAEHEMAAVKRSFVAAKQDSNMVALGIYNDDLMIAFAINELLYSGIAINHFIKADTKYLGIFSYLMRENANLLVSHQRTYLNFEQDLGLPGLRQSKGTFRPIYFLKKYAVKFARNYQIDNGKGSEV